MAGDPSGIGEFVIESLLGEGGMGKVYRARQVALDRWVALKVLAHAKDNRDFIERFYREARSAAQLVHPNIIQIYTVGEHDGIPYFAMEYVEGTDLEHLGRVDPESLSLEETIEVVRSVAKALTIATEQGIVHRDIKPGNIMITKTGLIKVMDFGLAKGVSADHAVTQAGLIVGTPTYMSPEQGSGRPVDCRSDIYSLGCVLYQCLCDRPPFAAGNVASLIYKHTYEDPVSPATIRSGLPPEIERLCLKMMAKKPEDRYQDPGELLDAMAQVPANPSLGEMLLAKRVAAILNAAKQRSPKPAAAASAAPQSRGERQVSPVPAAKAPGSSAAPMLKTMLTPPPGAPAPPRAAVTPFPETMSRQPSKTPTPFPAAPAAPAAPRQTASHPGLPVETAAAAPETAGKPRTLTGIIKRSFQKLSDGRWSYRAELGQCSLAEGLAATLRSPPGSTPQGLGDCLLCANWNKRLGCAQAYTYDLEARHRYEGLKLLVEQSIAWAGAGRFDRAISLLDEYVKRCPEDPEGFRELARVYDHPEYRARDKRRAIVLYRRFIELAQAADSYSTVEVSRAIERANALMTSPLEAKTTILGPGTGVAFQCFFRAGVVGFGYGVATGDQLVMTKAGDIDPDSGLTSVDMGSAVMRATAIFRRLRSEQARKEETSRVKEELARLSALSLDELVKDPACAIVLPTHQISGCDIEVDKGTGIRDITLKAAQVHHLLFTEAAAFKADQCYELLRRKLAWQTSR